MLDISRLSKEYTTRLLNESDLDEIRSVCRGNDQFYRYCDSEPDDEHILNDMHITPPGIDHEDKYYIGFYKGGDLVAIMDLIDGFPQSGIAYIGFFMMNMKYQGRQIGSGIIDETISYLRSVGMKEVRLAIDKENPQSNHFWKKNGFEVKAEVDVNGWTKLAAERAIT